MMLPRLKQLADQALAVFDRLIGATDTPSSTPPLLTYTVDPNDHDTQRREFVKHFPMAVWDEERGGFTDPKYTYALAGWIMHLEHSMGILNPRDLYDHGPVNVPPRKKEKP